MEQSRPQGISYWVNVNLRTVQGRITFAFFLTMLTGVGLIVYNDWNWQQAQSRQSVLVRQIQPIRIESFKLIYLIRETQSDLLRYLYLGKEEFIQKNRQAWLVDIPAQKDTLGHYVNLYKDEEISNLLTVVNKYLGELKNQQRLIERTLTTNRDPVLIQQEFQNDLLFAQTQFEKATQRLINRVVQAERRLLQKVESGIQTHHSLQIVITLLAFLVCYVVGIFLFRQIFLWIRAIRDQLNALQEGYLPPLLPNRSNEFRSIQKHTNALGQSLQRLKEYADSIEAKDFQANLDVFLPKSPLGMALSKMQETLRQISREEQERSWNNKKLAEMSEILRLYTHDIHTLCQKLVQQLVESLDAVQGGIFILRKPEEAPPYFELLASYAYGRHKFIQHQVKTDEGLLGRVYHEREEVYLEELPPDYSLITSGLGNASPRALMLMPLKNEDKAMLGAVELSFMRPLPAYQQHFLGHVLQ
ncbi:MAG: GAF domain-containing protein [Microscillaceae bacterium]|nr:GAF domain-containing protein [Microscillaceae bacterium]